MTPPNVDPDKFIKDIGTVVTLFADIRKKLSSETYTMYRPTVINSSVDGLTPEMCEEWISLNREIVSTCDLVNDLSQRIKQDALTFGADRETTQLCEDFIWNVALIRYCCQTEFAMMEDAFNTEEKKRGIF